MNKIRAFFVISPILRDCGGVSCTGRGSLCFSGGFGSGLLSPGLHPLDLLGAHPLPAGKSGFVRDLDAAGKAPVQAVPPGQLIALEYALSGLIAGTGAGRADRQSIPAAVALFQPDIVRLQIPAAHRAAGSDDLWVAAPGGLLHIAAEHPEVPVITRGGAEACPQGFLLGGVGRQTRPQVKLAADIGGVKGIGQGIVERALHRDANVLDTFSIHLRPRIFRTLQHHIAKVTGLTQADLDRGEPIVQGLRRFMQWCGPDAEFAEWGMDDVPVLKQNLFLCNLDESRPTVWYDLQQLFLREYPRKEGEGMKLENVVTRMGIPLERPFHDALSDTLYTADLCRMLDLRAGLAAYPSEEDTLRQSLCPTPGDYRDFRVFRGYLDQTMWKLDPVIGTMACPVCGTALQPDDVWLKKGSSGWYTLSQCPVCKGRGGEAGRGVFQKYRMSRRDGLHWAFARCVQMPDDASLVRWKKQKAQYLERQRLKAERQAAEAEAARHIF